MKKQNNKSFPALYAGVFAAATAFAGSVHQLPMPPPSGFVDTEASTNVVFAPLLEDTRQYRLKFSGDFTPSNNLEVAFGGDANGDGDLSPEETEARFGVDCGEGFAEVGRGLRSAPEMEGANSIPAVAERRALPLHLTRDQQARWNLMKVTRRGFFSGEPTVTLKSRKPGLMIIVR